MGSYLAAARRVLEKTEDTDAGATQRVRPTVEQRHARFPIESEAAHAKARGLCVGTGVDRQSVQERVFR